MKPRSANRLVILIAAGVGIGVLVWGFSRGLERYDQTVPVRPSRTAMTDPYLALRRWFASQDIESTNARRGFSLNDLDEYKVAIVDGAAFARLGGYEGIIPWVERGGNLVLILNPDDLVRNRRGWPRISDELSFYGYYISRTSEIAANAPELLRARFGNEIFKSVHVDTSPLIRTAHGNLRAFVAAKGGGNHLITLEQRKGFFTISGRPWFMENQYVGSEDNGIWTWALVSEAAAKGPMLFFITDTWSGGNQYDRHILVAIVGAVVLCILLFWNMSRRLGAPFELREDSGADISRRLVAEGLFLWKNIKSESVIATCQTDVRIALSLLGFVNANGELDLEGISASSGISSAEIKEIMDPYFSPVWANQVKEAVAMYKQLKELI